MMSLGILHTDSNIVHSNCRQQAIKVTPAGKCKRRDVYKEAYQRKQPDYGGIAPSVLRYSNKHLIVCLAAAVSS